MTASKKWPDKGFFSSDHGADLSRELAKEYLRQAGVTKVGQVSRNPDLNPIREVLRTSLKRRAKKSLLAKTGVKRLAKK